MTSGFMHSFVCPFNVNLEGYQPGSNMDSITGRCPREAHVGGVGPLLASTAPPFRVDLMGHPRPGNGCLVYDPSLVGTVRTSRERSSSLAGQETVPISKPALRPEGQRAGFH